MPKQWWISVEKWLSPNTKNSIHLKKNFNQGLNSGELVWKMAKSKHQKQH